MEFLHDNKDLFIQAINLVFSKTKIRPEIIEKDYYVTMILRLLSEKLPFIVFKGGTSLSKCHKIIKRFSEDIDITIDTSISQSQRKKVKETIEEICKILNLSIPNIDETRSRRDYNRYEIAFTSVQDIEDYAVQPKVILETSYTTISFPVIQLDVHNYIGDMMLEEAPKYIEKYLLSPFKMKVQNLDRTLADKVFAICDYYLQEKIFGHSRHLYDIYKLLPFVPQNDSFKNLVLEVRKIRAKSPVCPSALPEVNICNLVNKIIEENAYRHDYENLTVKLLEEKVSYNDVITSLKTISKNNIF